MNPPHELLVQLHEMTPEARLNALAEICADGILHLASTGRLEEVLSSHSPGPLPTDSLPTGGKEGSVSNGP